MVGVGWCGVDGSELEPRACIAASKQVAKGSSMSISAMSWQMMDGKQPGTMAKCMKLRKCRRQWALRRAVEAFAYKTTLVSCTALSGPARTALSWM